LLAIGDIHGCFTSLRALWGVVQPSVDDVVVFLGDYVDRGVDSRQVLDLLVVESAKPNRVFLRGNHEVMMLGGAENPFRADSWRECGGRETLLSYGLGEGFDWPQKIPAAHWDFLRATLPFYETANHLFVHGCLNPELNPSEQLEDMLYWQTFEQLWPHKSGKKVVCGHTTMADGKIVDVGHGVCIDTGAAYGGWLTCLDVNSGDYWQTNEEGQTRGGTMQRVR
jgi:serine/threonine protein phosphatase 1